MFSRAELDFVSKTLLTFVGSGDEVAWSAGGLHEGLQVGEYIYILINTCDIALIRPLQAVANASSFKGDASKVYTIGGSAGGALALQIANAVIREPGLKTSLRGIAAMVPCTTHWDNVPSKYADKYKSYTENARGTPIIDGESMEIFFKHLEADGKDPSAFTILATDKHAEFPPVYMTSCEFDPLRDDATIMELALKEAGVPVKHDYWAGFPHYFWIIPPVPEGQQYVGKLIEESDVGGWMWVVLVVVDTYSSPSRNLSTICQQQLECVPAASSLYIVPQSLIHYPYPRKRPL